MLASLAEKRAHMVVCVSKITDETFAREFPRSNGWVRLDRWPKRGPDVWEKRILLWPKQQKTMRDTLLHQREVFGYALDALTREGKRGVAIDESLMFNDPSFIGMSREVGLMHYYGRSAGLSIVDLTQRPSWIPRVIYSSITHAYVARIRDREDAKRLGDLGGIDAREVGSHLMRLPSRHDYVYLNPQGDAPSVIVNTRK
jgi:hypothetical protein